MSNKKQSKWGNMPAQIAAGVVQIMLFAALGIWGAFDCAGESYVGMFLGAIALFAVLHILATGLIIRRITASEQTQDTAEEAWFDRTMRLEEPTTVQGFSVEREITAIHSDFTVA